MNETSGVPEAFLECPYLTKDREALPMTIRSCPEDFIVEELPAYLPSGEGDHVYFWVEKRGLSTHEVIRAVAKTLNVAAKDIGSAGLKDARAIARQMFSLEHVDPSLVEALAIPGLTVLSVSRHKNKLKPGHLRGNRFVLRLRGIDPARFDEAVEALAFLKENGVPNYFGNQRFGVRGDTWLVGRALLAGDYREAASWIAGRPVPSDPVPSQRGREFFEQGAYEQAAQAWPRKFPEAVRLCNALARNRGDFRKAFYAIDARMQKFYVSAFQSRIFNRVLAARVERLKEVWLGDWVIKHENGAPFIVKDPADSLRAAAFEISAAGPLFGKEMRETEGEPARIEAEALAAEGVLREAFDTKGVYSCAGDRRLMRLKLEEASLTACEEGGEAFWELRLSLPAGCYATVVLRELGKDLLKDAGSRTADSENKKGQGSEGEG